MLSQLFHSPLRKKVKSLSRARLFGNPWTIAHQAAPSIEFSSQEYWSGLPFPYPGDLPDPGIEPGSPTLQADALPSEPSGNPFVINSSSLTMLCQIQWFPVNEGQYIMFRFSSNNPCPGNLTEDLTDPADLSQFNKTLIIS